MTGVDTPAEPSPRPLVLRFEWLDKGAVRDEVYGPFEVAEDDSHLTAITGFVKGWQGRTGITPASVTLALCVNPEEWLAGNVPSAAKAPD